jgi:mono/diheme cytochrome c family protein
MVIAHSWKVPADAARVANPIASTPESQTRGKVYYNDYCLACHGRDARGDGVAGTALKPPPPDLYERKKHHADGDFFWKIQNGRGQMPGFARQLKEKQIWDIVNYIKSIGPL